MNEKIDGLLESNKSSFFYYLSACLIFIITIFLVDSNTKKLNLLHEKLKSVSEDYNTQIQLLDNQIIYFEESLAAITGTIGSSEKKKNDHIKSLNYKINKLEEQLSALLAFTGAQQELMGLEAYKSKKDKLTKEINSLKSQVLSKRQNSGDAGDLYQKKVELEETITQLAKQKEELIEKNGTASGVIKDSISKLENNIESYTFQGFSIPMDRLLIFIPVILFLLLGIFMLHFDNLISRVDNLERVEAMNYPWFLLYRTSGNSPFFIRFKFILFKYVSMSLGAITCFLIFIMLGIDAHYYGAEIKVMDNLIQMFFSLLVFYQTIILIHKYIGFTAFASGDATPLTNTPEMS